MKKIILMSCIAASAALLTGCATGGGGIPLNFGVGIPVGPFGSVNLGMNTAGQMSVGAGTNIGGVGVGVSTPVLAPMWGQGANTTVQPQQVQPQQMLPQPQVQSQQPMQQDAYPQYAYPQNTNIPVTPRY